jgi:hypothetical protein
MDAILNNPFRILGLPTNASDKEIAKRVSDLLIYAEMGKKVSYETDFLFLGELDRSVDAIKSAAKKIELPENKIFYSLLCFDLRDNFERESINFLAKGDFEDAINVLKNEIYNNCSIIYTPENTYEAVHILKNFKQHYTPKYAITLSLPKAIPESFHTNVSHNYFVNIFNDNEIVYIKEGYSEINYDDKFQIGCKFKWVITNDSHDVSIGLGFIDDLGVKYLVQLTNKGVIEFLKSEHLEMKNEIEKTIFHETKSNYLALLRYDNFIEVRFNGKVTLKLEMIGTFKSSFLCFSGKQKVLIEDLSISRIKHFKVLGLDNEINENTFSFSKNVSLIYLIQTIKTRQVGRLISYFTITGYYLKKPYFITYTKEIISNSYVFNFNKLADIFVHEFFLSLKHLIDPNKELSQFKFYNSFLNLSADSEKKVKDMLSNSKPYVFENYIKEISLMCQNEPKKAYDYACDLKNESINFFNWYADFHTEFHNFRSVESRSISDKIGNEILECSISYFNVTSPKTIELAEQSLKLMTWAADFAFNQELRDRINKNISILLNSYPNTEYKIVDFEFKDRTRTSRLITPKDKPASPITNKVPPLKQRDNSVWSKLLQYLTTKNKQ